MRQRHSLSGWLRLILSVAVFGGVLLAGEVFGEATVVVKSDTASLDFAADWIGGSAPGPTDVASFTTGISAGNLASLFLANDAFWQGLSLGPSNGPLTITSSRTLTLGTAGINLGTANHHATISVQTLDLAGTIGNLTVNDSAGTPVDLTITSTIRNGSLTITGNTAAPGSVTVLSGASTYTGRTMIKSGTLRAGASATVFGIGSAVTVGGDAVRSALLDLDGYNVTIGSLTLGAKTSNVANNVQTGAGTLTLGGDVVLSASGSSSSTISGNLALGATRNFFVANSVSQDRELVVSALISGGGAGLTKSGVGVLVLTGANTYTGVTKIGSAPSLALGGRILVSGPSGSIKLSETTVSGTGSQLQLDYSGVADGAVDRYGDAQALTLTLGGELFLQGGTAGTNASESIGTLRLGSGKGTVTIDVPGADFATLGAAGFDRGADHATGLIRGPGLGLTASPSARLLLGTPAGLNLLGTGIAAGATNLKIVPFLLGSNSATGSGTNFLTYGTNGVRTLALAEQSLVASGAVGDNVRAVSGLNTVTGARVYNSLLIGLQNGTDTPSSTGSTVRGSGPLLTLTSGALATVNGSGANFISGFSSMIFGTTGANEAIITVASSTLTIVSPIDTVSPGGGLTKAGAGTLLLTASNLYTGPTTINEGTLVIGAETAGDLGGNTADILVQRGATLSFNRTGDTLTVPNLISGQGGVTQNSGTIQLAGLNSYTGPTNIFGGTLLVSGSIAGSETDVGNAGILQLATGALAGSVIVESGGTLRGTGRADAVSVQAGGTLAPGTGIGLLKTGLLSFENGSRLELEIGNTAADSVEVAGAVTLDGYIDLSITLQALSPNTRVLTILNGASPLLGYDLNARLAYGNRSLAEGDIFTVTDGGISEAFLISYAADGGNDVTLTVVPEPGTAAALLSGLGCLASFQRRRTLKRAR